MKHVLEEERLRTLAHLRAAIAECDRAHTPEELDAASAKLKAYMDSLSPVQQYELLAGPRDA